MKETISVNLASQAFTFDKVRLATLLLVLVGGLSIWVYILLWIVVPKGPKRLEGNSR